MFYYLILIILALAILYYSLCSRVKNKYRQGGLKDLPTDPIDSPVSRALTETLGLAGGIYLALVMATSFLQVEVPEKIAVFSLEMEPLAFTSILLAVVQPFVSEIINYFRR